MLILILACLFAIFFLLLPLVFYKRQILKNGHCGFQKIGFNRSSTLVLMVSNLLMFGPFVSSLLLSLTNMKVKWYFTYLKDFFLKMYDFINNNKIENNPTLLDNHHQTAATIHDPILVILNQNHINMIRQDST